MPTNQLQELVARADGEHVFVSALGKITKGSVFMARYFGVRRIVELTHERLEVDLEKVAFS
jgi:hypothetical protein